MKTKINYKKILGAIIISLPFVVLWWVSVFSLGALISALIFGGFLLVGGCMHFGFELLDS